MNYYEELGVSQSATAEEIRQAYRNLARVLHPDQQQEETLRRLAECQMKRLNSICAVLTDPKARQAYDRELLGAPPRAPLPAPEPVRARLARSQAWIWLAAAVIGAAAALAYFGSEAAGRRVTREATLAEAASQEPRAQPANPVPPIAPRRAERKVRSSRVSTAAVAPPSPALPEPPDLAAGDGVVAAGIEPSQFEIPAAATPAPPAKPTYAGTWFYAQPKARLASALYLPEFIEAVIVEEAGMLHGRYRARYRISDRAISPDVRFQFSGPAEREAPRLEWTGGGGAKGEVRLKLLSENSLQVDWTASSLGTSLGLGSGTAVLTRRQVP